MTTRSTPLAANALRLAVLSALAVAAQAAAAQRMREDAAEASAAAAERRDEWQRQASAALAGLEDGVRALEADMLALRLDLRLGLQGVGAEGGAVGFSRAPGRHNS